jgi:hypothetical protein
MEKGKAHILVLTHSNGVTATTASVTPAANPQAMLCVLESLPSGPENADAKA